MYILIGGRDFTAGRHNAMFHAGMIHASVYINITNDDIFEENESFTVNFIGNTLPRGVFQGATRRATITIMDIGELCIYLYWYNASSTAHY